MKRQYLLTIMILPAILTACGNAQASTPSLDVGGTFTAVASTLIAGEPTTTTQPSAIPEPTSLATATFFPTIQVVNTVVNPVVSYSSVASTTTCDDASYVSDVTIDDGTEIYPGETFVKTWQLYNSGTCTWDEDYSLTYVSGSQMSGSDTALEDEIAPGEYVEISISMVAPTTEATYNGYWRMTNDDGTLFGDTIYVNIVVTDSASTSTPTPTATSTTSGATSTTAPTSTPEPTSTPVPATSTPIPTEIPTEVPASTESS